MVLMYKWYSVVSSSRPLHYLELTHHTHSFVLSIVTVEHTESPVALKTSNHASCFSGFQKHRILISCIFGIRGSPVAAQHLKIDQMHMDGVISIARELPDLGCAQARSRVNSVRIEVIAINQPHAQPLRESKAAWNGGFAWIEWLKGC